MLQGMIKFFIEKPLILKLVKIFIAIFGLLQLSTFLVESFPQVPLDMVIINTVYPGASPADIEKEVTKKIEDKIENISGIKLFQSITVENVSTVVVEINKDLPARTKKDSVEKIKTAVESIVDFPTDVETPLVQEISIDMPLISIAVTSPKGKNLNENLLRKHADDLEEIIKKMNGVKEIKKYGYREQEVLINLNPGRLQAYNVSLGNVIQTIQNNYHNLPAGDGLQKNTDYWLRTIGEAKDPGALGNQIVRSNFEGVGTRINQIGTVGVALQKESNFYTANGQRTIILTIFINEKANILKLAKRVNKTVAEFDKNIDSHVYVFDDNSRWVQRRLSLLLGDAFTGFVLVTLFLMFFLKPRSGFETALEIPMAFLVTLLFMKLFDISINAISMIGLIMVAGMLVDDAIIISENIHRHLEMKKTPKQAALDGIGEVAGPVAITILTTILGFLPLALMTGLIGQILKIIPMIVIFALVASGLQSYFSLPTNIVEASEHHPEENHDSGKIALKDRFLNAVAKKYHQLALPLFRRKKLAIGFVIFTLVFSIVFAGAKMRFTFIPEEGVEIFFITTEAPIGTTLEKNHEYIKKIEQKLAQYPKRIVTNYVSAIGSTGFGQRDSEIETGKRLAQVSVYLTPGNARRESTEQIMEEMRVYVEKMKVFKEFIVDQANYGPPAPKPIYIKLTGPDFAVLDKVGKDISEFVKKIPGTKEVQYSFKAQNPEMHLKLREAQIARFGLTSREVAREIRAAFDGIKVGEMLVGNDTVDIRIRLNMPEKEIRDVLRNIYIDNHRGGFIPLPQLIEIEETTGPSRIIHENGLRLVSVQGKIDIKKGSVREVVEAVKKKFPDPFKGDMHYNLEFAGENKETNESLQSMGILFIAAIFLVFFCLVAFFNSVTLPLIVMMSIPFSIIGVIWAFFIHGQPISFPALMGMVGLGGVVVKDGIVLVSFIEQLRREGMPVFEAVEKGTLLRIRPILITTCTTIAGLLPTAYGIGGYDPFIKPLALSFAWGLGFSTFLTLFMLPAIYLAHEEWLVRRKDITQRYLGWILNPVRNFVKNGFENLIDKVKFARS